MTLPHEALGNAIAELSAHLNAAKSRLIALIGEFDESEGWADEGCLTCAHWLNWKCGVSPNAAREQVRVARALKELPLTREAFGSGRLSYSKVRAMTRVATPDSEQYLLMLAEHGTAAHLERVVRGVRRCREERALREANEQHDERNLQWWWDDHGMLAVQGRLDAEQGARFIAAVDTEMRVVERERKALASAETPVEGVKPLVTFGAMRADALVRLIDGDNPDTEIIVHVSAETLAGDRTGDHGRTGDESACDGSDGEMDPARCCELQDGPALAPETARRLACDAGVVRLLEDADGEPLSVGRRTRSIPPAIRRALKARDGGCRFPGCASTACVEGHHVHHWSRGGATSMENLVSLCRHHHRLVHEGGFAVEHGGDGAFRFLRPGGRAIEAAAPRFARDGCARRRLVASNEALGLRIDERTGVSLWDGVPMDESMAVEGVLAAGGELEL